MPSPVQGDSLFVTDSRKLPLRYGISSADRQRRGEMFKQTKGSALLRPLRVDTKGLVRQTTMYGLRKRGNTLDTDQARHRDTGGDRQTHRQAQGEGQSRPD